MYKCFIYIYIYIYISCMYIIITLLYYILLYYYILYIIIYTTQPAWDVSEMSLICTYIQICIYIHLQKYISYVYTYIYIYKNIYIYIYIPAGMRCLWEISIRSPLRKTSRRPLRNVSKKMTFVISLRCLKYLSKEISFLWRL